MDEEKLNLRTINDTGIGSNEYFDNEIAKENVTLQMKYEELLKEIEEKSKLMDEQLKNKDASALTMGA
jgi:hypothetical protein